jgi:enoyl-CoA hydratase/carnithine racemase
VWVRPDWRDAGLRVESTGAVVRVTLSRPDVRNAQTPAMWRALAQLGVDLPEAIRVVVLAADGPSFSAGLDRAMFAGGIPGEPTLTQLGGLPESDVDAQIAQYQSAFTWWRETDAVTVAAVQGHAVGAGFQLALACDLRIVADDVAFAMRETSLGLVPDLGGTGPLVAAVGYPRALEICGTGRWVHAAEAVSVGLAQACVPVDDLAAATDDLVAALLAAPEAALAATKRLLLQAVDSAPAVQRQHERTAQFARLRELGGP